MRFSRVLIGSLVLAPAFSFAAVDTAAITAAATDVATVGAAVFAVYVGVKLWQWIRRAL